MADGTKDDPWVLKTPPGTSEYTMYRDETRDPPALVCQVGKTQLSYHLSCIDDLHAMLKEHGDWVALGSADEQKPAKEDTVEAWARSETNPSAAGTAAPPLKRFEELGLAELEQPRNPHRAI